MRAPAGFKYVYVMASARGTPVKIGIARDAVLRLQTINTSSPYRYRVEYTTIAFPEDLARRVEARAHKTLAGYRMNGEWFSAGAWLAVQTVMEAADFLQREPVDYGTVNDVVSAALAKWKRKAHVPDDAAPEHRLKNEDTFPASSAD